MNGHGGSEGFLLPVGTVTLLLADVEGSVSLWETDRDAMTAAVGRLDALVTDVVNRHRGVRPVEQGEGDSFVAAFSRASDAVACAVDLQLAIARESWSGKLSVRLRMGIHTGEVQLRDEGNYIGSAVNRCARLRDIGHGGQTLVSKTTHSWWWTGSPTAWSSTSSARTAFATSPAPRTSTSSAIPRCVVTFLRSGRWTSTPTTCPCN